ncbi:aspartate kinase [Saprospira sp. CCB-QB6]|uniref:aspartate kinase n=1 Tax=Saprospira sp. CCB-QB6 TaxID=3023936 RepID=UPI00234BE377|nr:aspartate kinase [Saprospira sp. CCB-QB6]WCL80882.1 aspartate kinase [Saprospira sp. CCB-QB6]
MPVFKFGGASIKDVAAIKNVVQILRQYQQEQPLVVVSASGKITNALEKVVQAYVQQTGQAEVLLQGVRQHHLELLQGLFENPQHPIYDEINDLFVDVEWILEEEPQDSYDYLYDQIVSLGELLSTTILAAYLNEEGLPTHWLDVRDCILTDNSYRDAQVDWAETQSRIQKIVPALPQGQMVLTQGFLGSSSENFTTTLGREGSDYTAAIFAFCLNADRLAIWKDVPGLLNADPRIFDKTVLLDNISYAEAIEMTYYGAQVIHPKTLRPLQNKNIPLWVKSFVQPQERGSLVSSEEVDQYPPIFVVKKEQALLKIKAKDFQFVDEARFSALFASFAKHRIKVNMTQNTALAFSVCINYEPQKLGGLLEELAQTYMTELRSDLQLISLRHQTEEALNMLRQNKEILLEEHIGCTSQLLIAAEALWS